MDRRTARENAFLLLFGEAFDKELTAGQMLENAEVLSLETDDYVRCVVTGTREHRQAIDELVDSCLVGWKKERVSAVSRAILLYAAYELLYMPDIPVKVCINEAVELSKKYDDEKSYTFVNGVLNAAAKKARSE